MQNGHLTRLALELIVILGVKSVLFCESYVLIIYVYLFSNFFGIVL